jgi:hypothetical protein
MWPGAGHYYQTDEPRADEEVVKFLQRHSPQAPVTERQLDRTSR